MGLDDVVQNNRRLNVVVRAAASRGCVGDRDACGGRPRVGRCVACNISGAARRAKESACVQGPAVNVAEVVQRIRVRMRGQLRRRQGVALITASRAEGRCGPEEAGR